MPKIAKNICIHKDKYLRSHPKCQGEALFCSEKCPRQGHIEDEHDFIQIKELDSEVKAKKDRKYDIVKQQMEQLDKVYAELKEKLDAAYSESKCKIETVCFSKQQNILFSLIEAEKLHALSCSNIHFLRNIQSDRREANKKTNQIIEEFRYKFEGKKEPKPNLQELRQNLQTRVIRSVKGMMKQALEEQKKSYEKRDIILTNENRKLKRQLSQKTKIVQFLRENIKPSNIVGQKISLNQKNINQNLINSNNEPKIPQKKEDKVQDFPLKTSQKIERKNLQKRLDLKTGQVVYYDSKSNKFIQQDAQKSNKERNSPQAEMNEQNKVPSEIFMKQQQQFTPFIKPLPSKNGQKVTEKSKENKQIMKPFTNPTGQKQKRLSNQSISKSSIQSASVFQKYEHGMNKKVNEGPKTDQASKKPNVGQQKKLTITFPTKQALNETKSSIVTPKEVNKSQFIQNKIDNKIPPHKQNEEQKKSHSNFDKSFELYDNAQVIGFGFFDQKNIPKLIPYFPPPTLLMPFSKEQEEFKNKNFKKKSQNDN